MPSPPKGAPPPIRWPQKQNARPVQPAMPRRLAPPPVPPPAPGARSVQRQVAPGGQRVEVVQPYSWAWLAGGAGVGFAVGGALGAVVGTALGAAGGAAADYATDYYHWMRDATPWQYLSRGVGGNLQGAALVEALFNRFLGYRFRYDVSQALWEPMVRDTGELTQFQRGDDIGNCEAFAGAFAAMLQQANIGAQVRAVRAFGQGHFIAHVPNFIDPSVRGNVYNNGSIVPGYYVFDNHWATWVPSRNMFYDPMARSRYTQVQFDQNVLVCDLVKVNGNDDLFRNQNGGNILPNVNGKTRLARRNAIGAGRLELFDLQT